uniref:Uncharacterized protein n=1 Tax=Picea glauca TaxID=3330 RepID=A0A101LUQ7_PICGL|nr:hypothetical protein ABT39_MTgene2537 [Picea glauca]QHR89680.1 hypothetical protein Q903MT_gene3702 [Picea sitchensis]
MKDRQKYLDHPATSLTFLGCPVITVHELGIREPFTRFRPMYIRNCLAKCTVILYTMHACLISWFDDSLVKFRMSQ